MQQAACELISQAASAHLTEFLLDSGDVVGEVVDGSAVTVYLRGANLISNGTSYYLFNAHGDVVQTVDAAGVVTKEYSYDAFGNEKDPDEADGNPFRYCGEYFDAETGLYYLRARYYDPALGRFTQEDTYRGTYNDPLSLNYYVYCYSNPVIYADANGHMPVETLNKLSYRYNHNILEAEWITTATFLYNKKNIYTAFHEIAQLNLAKRLYGLGYSPYLEYKIPGVGEADVVVGNMAWEVKPILRSGGKQLQKYLNGGGLVAGHTFKIIDNIPIWGDYKMAVFPSSTEPGVAHYSFYRMDKQGARCYVPSTEVKREIEKSRSSSTSDSTTVPNPAPITTANNVLDTGAYLLVVGIVGGAAIKTGGNYRIRATAFLP